LLAQTAEGQKSGAELQIPASMHKVAKTRKIPMPHAGMKQAGRAPRETTNALAGSVKRPENSAEKNSPPERMQPIHGWAFMR
jgi:hypothetical protein